MKWPSKEPQRQRVVQKLTEFSHNVKPLLGLQTPVELGVLSRQIIASMRREEYFEVIQRRGPIGAHRANPHDPAFEAELGVVHLLQTGNIDDAAWLIFLMVMFGKPDGSGWTRLQDVYGKLGRGKWDWESVNADPDALTAWLATSWMQIRGKFGNHRKYESMRPDADRPIGEAIRSYVAWVSASGGHSPHFAQLVRAAGNHPHEIFDAFYQAIPAKGFGRLGRFDWVSMVARYGMIPAEAGSAYLNGATGPTFGAKLLFYNDRKAKFSLATVQSQLDELDRHLNVGMEVLEDSLCNWQKSPQQFKHFKG